MKYSSLGGGGVSGFSATRWRFKRTLKAFMITLFTLSTVFITYQLIYYMSLTEYQSQESQRQLELLVEGNTNIKSKSPSKLVSGVDVVNSGPKSSKVHVGFERKKGKPILSSKILGVRPTDLHFYQNQQTNNKKFKCLSTHKLISWDKVNDDFCDCPFDGSDEPSTAACENGKFYCLIKGGIKDFIPSSRVNDGVCDCLDGTDEHASKVTCKKISPYF